VAIHCSFETELFYSPVRTQALGFVQLVTTRQYVLTTSYTTLSCSVPSLLTDSTLP